LDLIAGTIPPNERIIQIQHAEEIGLPQKHVIPLETRPANLEGKGEITMRDLVLNALKMRPDRLIVCEVWGAEVLELFRAINNGHDGTMFTLHANSPREALASLEVMTTSANPSLPLLNVRQMMTWALDLIVQTQRLRDGTRKVVKITEVEDMQGDVISLGDIFEFQQTGFEGGQISGRFTATGRIPKLLSRLQAAGIELPLNLFTPR